MLERLRHLPGWLRVVGGAASGALTGLAFAPVNWWPMAFVGVAGLTFFVSGLPRLRLAALVGFGYGLVLLVSTIVWMTVIAPEAAIALLGFQSLWYGLLGLLLAWATRTRWAPVLGPGCWLMVEFLFGHVPFGGFPWLRLGYTQVDGPFAGLLPFVGTPGVSFAIAFVGGWLASLVTGGASRRMTLGVGITCFALVGVGLSAMNLVRPRTDLPETLSVGYVQGNAPGGGIYGIGGPRTTTYNHLKETRVLMDKVAAGQVPQPDFVVWPENGTDMDPTTDTLTDQALKDAVAATKAPLFAGIMGVNEASYTRRTIARWINADGSLGDGYEKRNMVPFGEWVPFRNILEPLFPMLSYVGEQGIPGSEPGVVTGVLNDGTSVQVGVGVCYDVAFDTTMYDTVTRGGQVVIVQSSNAMYMGTSQIVQQFAISRVRAVELQREILVVTTSGISGLIRPDGSVAVYVGEHVAASGVVPLPLRDNITPATWLSPLFDGVASGATGLAVLAAAALSFRSGRRGRRVNAAGSSGDNASQHSLPERDRP